jgi:hypothetical protein
MTHTSENIRVATTRVVRLRRCHAVVVTGYRDGVDRYAMWDAAYVLGSLSAADRREFEAHMANCPACWDAVEDLSGLPALLSQLTVKRSPRSTSPARPSRRHLRCRRRYCRSLAAEP